MRYINILTIGLLISCSTSTENKSNSDEIDKVNIQELEKLGFESYQDSPIKSIQLFKEVAMEYEKTENYKKAGFTNLNIANIYDEYIENIDSALVYSKKALKIWKTQNDTLQMANLYKYIGLLKGKSDEIDEAKSDIQQAIMMYQKVGFEQGVAVSEFNLADVNFRNKDYEGSMDHLNNSTDFWKKKKDYTRIYTNNILGIRIYSATNNHKRVEALIEENIVIEQKTNINDFAKNMFDDLIKEIKSKTN
jgi:tetratricopeptide (TPR) repeat protein